MAEEMELRYQTLPPLKRLRLMQKKEDGQKTEVAGPVNSSQLPAKKRKESRRDYAAAENVVSSFCLPAKKRVWAIDPELLSGKPLLPFDLNLGYNPSLDEEKMEINEREGNPIGRDRNGMVVSSSGVKGKENLDPLAKQKNFESGKKLGELEITLAGELKEENEVVNDDVDLDNKGNQIGKGGNGMIDPSFGVENKEKINPLPKQKKFESVKKLGVGEITIAGKNKEDIEVKNDDNDDDLEDSDDGVVCAVCNSTDGDPSDPIVFCDGCDLMVHATCYGNPLVKAVPEGDWFCEQCNAIGSLEKQNKNDGETFSCCLCPIKSGPIKQTIDGQWAHITCSVFVPEVFFEDPEGREGINCSEIPKKRQKERCYVCKSRNGCVIECSEMKCPLSFHVTCGLKEELCIEYREGKKKKGGIVAGFCKDHSILWEKQQQTGKFKIVARDE